MLDMNSINRHRIEQRRIQTEFNYAQALKRADELEEVAQRIRNNIRSELSNSAYSIKYFWKGNASDKYMLKLSKAIEELETTASNYERVAATVRETAKRSYEMELRVIRIAESRTYKG